VNEHLLARAYDRDGCEWRMYGPDPSMITWEPSDDAPTFEAFCMKSLAWYVERVLGGDGVLTCPPEYRIVRVGPAVEAA
jgi:hypothetical protein